MYVISIVVTFLYGAGFGVVVTTNVGSDMETHWLVHAPPVILS